MIGDRMAHCAAKKVPTTHTFKPLWLLQGRMIDHLRNTQSVGLEDLAVLVLDEADRLLEMGFAEEVRVQ